MKVVICGSRAITDKDLVEFLIENSGFEITEVIEGGARGVDKIAGEWATAQNLPLTIMKAEWHLYGNRAGPVRNHQMVKAGDAVIAVWDGKSRGTRSTIEYANAEKKPVKVWTVN